MNTEGSTSIVIEKFSRGKSAIATTVAATVALILASLWLFFASISYSKQIQRLEEAGAELERKNVEIQEKRDELAILTMEFKQASAEAEQARINLAQQTSEKEEQIRRTASQFEVELRASESLIKGRKAFVSKNYETAAKSFEIALLHSKPQTPLLFNQAAWSYYLASTQPETDGRLFREQSIALFEQGLDEFPNDAHLLANYAAVVSEQGPQKRQETLRLADRLASLDPALAIQLSRAPQTRWLRQAHSPAIDSWRSCLTRGENEGVCSLSTLVEEKIP